MKTEGDMTVEQLDAIRRLIEPGPKSWNFHLPPRGVTGYRRIGIIRSGEFFELSVNARSDGVYSGLELLERLAELSPDMAKYLAEPLGVPK